jgi:thiol-disulfide isomerase/thioredoxin
MFPLLRIACRRNGSTMKASEVLLGTVLAVDAAACTRHDAAGPREELTAIGGVASSAGRTRLQLPVEGELPSLDGATDWLNSPRLTSAALRGKVVLVDFWTYSCINWRRTLPFLRAWADKYRAHGLVVIGVHTPEFQFEKTPANVRWAVKEMGIAYPVAVDSEYAIWRAFANDYWPALYFVDARGRLRRHQFGEGDYEQSERVIQELLIEAGATGVPGDLVSVDARGVEVAAAWDTLQSPETYVGYERAERFASPLEAAPDERRAYSAPMQLDLNQWALSGDWTIANWSATSNQANARVVYRFHARDLHLVMGPVTRGSAIRFRVLVDGQPPAGAHGVDVDAEGSGLVTEQRLYQLIRQPKPASDRLFEIQFLDSGAEIFSFTFG